MERGFLPARVGPWISGGDNRYSPRIRGLSGTFPESRYCWHRNGGETGCSHPFSPALSRLFAWRPAPGNTLSRRQPSREAEAPSFSRSARLTAQSRRMACPLPAVRSQSPQVQPFRQLTEPDWHRARARPVRPISQTRCPHTFPESSSFGASRRNLLPVRVARLALHPHRPRAADHWPRTEMGPLHSRGHPLVGKMSRALPGLPFASANF